MDGSDVTTNGTTVSSWNDQAALGGTQNFLQATSANQPTLLTGISMPNGSIHNIVDFDGTDDHVGLGADSNMDTNTFSCFAVVRGRTLSDEQSGAFFWTGYTYIDVSTKGTVNADRVWGLGEAKAYKGWSLFARNSIGDHTSVGQENSVDDQWYILSMVWDGPAGTIDGRFLDPVGNLETGTASDATANPSGHLRSRIGASSNPADNLFFNGQLAELLVYNRVLSPSEVLSMEEYLNQKYFINSGLGTIILIQ